MILAENSSVLDLTTLPTMAAAGKVKLKNETTIFQKAYYDQSRYICRLRHYPQRAEAPSDCEQQGSNRSKGQCTKKVVLGLCES